MTAEQWRKTAAAALLVLLSVAALGGAGCAAAVRVYDPEFGEYHYWDRNEEGVFRGYLSARHEPYKEFGSLNSDDQQAYWRWRHDISEANAH